jgi:hypothetical protein
MGSEMAAQDAKKFLEQIKSDANLRDALGKEIGRDVAAGIQKHASQLGLRFTTEELVKAYVEQLASQGLSQADIKDILSTTTGPELLVRYKATQAAIRYASYAPGGTLFYANKPKY